MYTHIEDNIYTIPVPLPNNPLRQLNSYVIKGEGRNLVIDTGFKLEECRKALCDGLEELGGGYELHGYLPHAPALRPQRPGR